jgi:hypothetical protein
MSRLRPGPAACLLAVAALLAPAAPAPAQPARPPFGEGTHAFRRILHDLELEPLAGVPQLDDPAHTLLIVLGETDVLDRVPGGLTQFLDAGGAALIATDRHVPHERLMDGFGLTVSGIPVRLLRDNPEDSRCYRGLNECPLLLPGRNQSPALFGDARLPGAADLSLHRVATNRPSYLKMEGALHAGLAVLATLPAGCAPVAEGRFIWRTPPLPFAVGGEVGKGRLLVLADHSLFINDMMLQPDTDNIDFTYNCLDWLRDGPKRNRVLFVEEGDIQTAFDIPLKDVPVPLPPLDALVPVADDALQNMERDNLFNKVVLDFMPFDRFVAALVVLLSVALAVYGLYRLVRSRHRVEVAAPLLDALLAKQPPAQSLMAERHRALLGHGNLWEPARALARQCFEAAGVAPPGGRPAHPTVRAAGGWWRRRALGRAVRRLWHLAYGTRPVPVSPQEFARLPDEVEMVKAALASGALQLGPVADGAGARARPGANHAKAEGTVA